MAAVVTPVISSLRVMSYKVGSGYEPPLKSMTTISQTLKPLIRVEGPSWVRSSPGIDEEDLRLMPALHGRLLCLVTTCDMVCDVRTWRRRGGPPSPRRLARGPSTSAPSARRRMVVPQGHEPRLRGLQLFRLTQPVDGLRRDQQQHRDEVQRNTHGRYLKLRGGVY